MIFEVQQQLVKTSCCKWLILVPLLLPFSPLLVPLFLVLLVLGFMLFPVSCAVIGLLTWQRLRSPPPSLELQADVKLDEKQAKLVECWADENSKGRAEDEEEHHGYGNGEEVDFHGHEIGYDDKNSCGDGVLFWYNPLASIFADDDAKALDGSSMDGSSADERTYRERYVDSEAAVDEVSSRLNAAMEKTRLDPIGISKMHIMDETMEDDSLEAVLQMAVRLQIEEAAESEAAEEQLLCRLDASANDTREDLTDLVHIHEIDETLEDDTLQAMLDMALQLQIEEGAYTKEMQESLYFTRANVSSHMLRADLGDADDVSEETFQDHTDQDNASVITIQGEDQDFDCMSYNSETNDFRACSEAELPCLISPVKRPMIVTSLSSSTSSLFSTSSTITSASTSTSTSSSSQTSPTNNKAHKLIKPVGLPVLSSRKPAERIPAKGRATCLAGWPVNTSSKKSDKAFVKRIEDKDAQFSDGHHYYSASGRDRAPIMQQHKASSQPMANPKATMEAHNSTGPLRVDAATRRARVSGPGTISSDSGTLRKGCSSESGGPLRRGGAASESGTLKKGARCSGVTSSSCSSRRASLPESSCITSNNSSSSSRRAPLPESGSARGNGGGGGSSQSRSRSAARSSVAAMAAAHSDGEHNPHSSSRVGSRSNIRQGGRCTRWSSVGSASATTLCELQEVWRRVVQGEGGRRRASSTMAGTVLEGPRAGGEVRPSMLLQFWRDMERLR